jgi:RNA polymerase sigma-70 factor (ECF subfamily)
LLERYAPPLFSAVILPRVRDRAEAEDVLREVLARAVAALPRFSDRGIGVWPWLRRIAVHALVDRARRRGAAERAMEAYMHEVEVARAGRADDAERAWLDAEEAAVQTRRLGAALALVPERYRRAIELRVLEERPRADVAAAMGVSVATFDVLLHRALAALRKAWSEVAASEEAARGARG